MTKKDFKGHVTLMKAFDDESDNSSARGHTKSGHVTLMKAFDDASDDIQEGKKGLNAVNVKLASNLGSSGQDGQEPMKRGCWNIGSSGQDGVSLFSGEVQECAVDLAIPGRELDFVWARTYHSRLGRSSATNGWTFSYDVSAPRTARAALMFLTARAAKTRSPLAPTHLHLSQLFREGTISNNIFTLAFADTGRWVFNPFDGTASAGLCIRSSPQRQRHHP